MIIIQGAGLLIDGRAQDEGSSIIVKKKDVNRYKELNQEVSGLEGSIGQELFRFTARLFHRGPCHRVIIYIEEPKRGFT